MSTETDEVLRQAKPSRALALLRMSVPKTLTRRRGHQLAFVTKLAMAVLAIIVLAAVFAPWLTPYDPAVGELADRLEPIGTPGHILGTDEQGRDMLTRLMYGGRISLLSALVPVALATAVALVLGLVAGSSRGILSAVIMRVLDVFFAFPAIMLAIGVTAALGPGLQNSFVALAIVFVPPLARVVEAATRRVSAMEYIQAAQLTGASRAKILVLQVLPNVLPSVFTYAASLMAVSMLLMAGLSFVGLGVSPPTAEWGYMLGSMRDQLYTYPVNAITPGFLIFLTAVALNTVSDGLRDASEER